MSTQETDPSPPAMDTLNAVVDALQMERPEEVVDLLNLAVNLTGYLIEHPEDLEAFRAGGTAREPVVARALASGYQQVDPWLAELVAPFAPGVVVDT